MKNKSKIYLGDSKEILPTLKPESIDLMVTDPPYGLAFMGKDWDRAVPSIAIWKECYRVLKPGAFAFIMSIPRQDCLSHMIVNLGDAGFDISFSSIYWTYATGFPKAQNLSKQADKRAGVKREILGFESTVPNRQITENWKKSAKVPISKGPFDLTGGSLRQITAPVTPQAKTLEGAYGGFQLKPAVEIIIVAMKPIEERTYLDQAIANGHGCTWLDDCRIPYQSDEDKPSECTYQDIRNKAVKVEGENMWTSSSGKQRKMLEGRNYTSNNKGRFPANLLCEDDVLDDGRVITPSARPNIEGKIYKTLQPINFYGSKTVVYGYPDKGSFSRYFSLDAWFEERIKLLPLEAQKTFPWLIIPKPSKAEKNKYVDLDLTDNSDIYNGKFPDPKADKDNISKHPTIKPVKLMSWLVTLGSREGDVVLDPFLGSGTTYIAASALGRFCKGIEIKKEYYDEAVKRCNLNQKNISSYF